MKSSPLVGNSNKLHIDRRLTGFLGLVHCGVVLALAAGCQVDVPDQPTENDQPPTEQVVEQPSPAGSGARPATSVKPEELKTMVKLFHMYHDAKGKGPSGWDGFIEWSHAQDQHGASTLEELKKLGVTFYCEQEIRKATNGTTQTIFAYCDRVPKSGGLVAFMDGSVKSLSAEEFKQKLDAQKQFAPSNASKKSN